MKNSIYTYLLVTLILNSCYQLEKPEKPNTFLSEQEMVNVLTEISILSAAKGINKKKLGENGILPKNYIYTKHKIDSVIFAENNIYYSHDLDAYNRIYNKVKDSLTLLKKKAEKNKEKKIKSTNINKGKLKEDELKLDPKYISKRDSIIRQGLLKRAELEKNKKSK
ncbi:DUF4296 domain-containing protein [Aurantibacter sp.]|uniref:DUF4296 domain-containing protein n=1 Tax=Aurantibacter sp. TaxID=2807103 RepID=UPI0035C7A241